MKSFFGDKLPYIGILLFGLGGLFLVIRILGLSISGFLAPFGILLGVVGFVLVFFPNIQPPSGESKILIKESFLFLEEILKSFDAGERCFYLPPRSGKMYVYVPLSTGISPSTAWTVMKAPIKTVTKVEDNPGLFLYSPFSYILKSYNKNMNVDDVLSRVLVDRFEVAESVKVSKSGGEFSLEISRPLLNFDLSRCEKVLGSFSSFLTGCILSAQINKPLILTDEELNGNVLKCRFRVP
jgi:hypothetical protein